MALDKTQRKIADEVGCSLATVRSWVKYYKAHKTRGQYRPLKFNPSQEWLQHHYIELDMSMREIADELGCSLQPVVNRLKEYGIHKPKRRLAQNHSKRMSGKNNPAWVSGGSQGFQKRKLQRSGLPEVCQWCGAENDVQIHHIDHDRSNHSLDNLTWLCGTCNILEGQLYRLEQGGLAEISVENGNITIRFLANQEE